MADRRSIGLVGAGSRGLSHVDHLHAVSDRQFVDRWEESWPLNSEDFPFGVYQDHASEVPQWAADISHLETSVTAVCDPSREARERAVERCRAHGDDPDTFESLDEFRTAGTCDTAVVASPNHTHADVVVALLEDGLDVFCEKLLAPALADTTGSPQRQTTPTASSTSASTCATRPSTPASRRSSPMDGSVVSVC